MITKENFKKLVYLMLEHDEFMEKLYDLGIDTLNCDNTETAGIIFDELMREEFGEEGADIVSWWMYEDVDHKIYASADYLEGREFFFKEETKHGEVIADVNNIDDLYEYLLKNNASQSSN